MRRDNQELAQLVIMWDKRHTTGACRPSKEKSEETHREKANSTLEDIDDRLKSWEDEGARNQKVPEEEKQQMEDDIQFSRRCEHL